MEKFPDPKFPDPRGWANKWAPLEEAQPDCGIPAGCEEQSSPDPFPDPRGWVNEWAPLDQPEQTTDQA